ncbi:universal stress protein [Streptomyces sp. NPDC088789]|uniref:universal stress protein n=1 Tax=Streptomyces sp. NPDC088789 TaxID=3365899 RepID=UPI0037F4F489
MELPLIVGIDGSDSSLEAIDWAVDEAARHGLPLRLVHASLWERYEGVRPAFARGRPAEEIMAQHIVASGVERARLRDASVKTSGEVLPLDPVAALLRTGPEAFALVTGARGRGQVTGLLLGSVSLSVAARAVCPVVVIRGDEPGRREARGRIVVGVGAPDDGSGALRFAVREAEVRGGTLTAVRAWRAPETEPVDPLPTAADATPAREERALTGLDDALRPLAHEHPGTEIRRLAVEGPAHRVLLDASADADLIVVGARRVHSHFGLQLGRVAHTLLHHSRCPVAVVPHPV